MSGEQITNNSVETHDLEGEHHSLKNSSKKKRENGINYFLRVGCSGYTYNWCNNFYLRKKNNIINS